MAKQRKEWKDLGVGEKITRVGKIMTWTITLPIVGLLIFGPIGFIIGLLLGLGFGLS